MSAVSMTREEREEFLARPHVGILSVAREGRPPLVLPMWFGYQLGGELTILTSATSTKGRLLLARREFSLCVQSEDSPYRYVSVEGVVTGARAYEKERDLRPLAQRYLGVEGGDDYTDNVPQSPDLTVYSLCPCVWYSVDYSKLDRPTEGD